MVHTKVSDDGGMRKRSYCKTNVAATTLTTKWNSLKQPWCQMMALNW